MKSFRTYLIFGITLLTFTSCSKETESIPQTGTAYALAIPPGFPEPIIPEDNTLNSNRVELGRKLFYDPILSLDSSISCASCHLQNDGFADNKNFSDGVLGKVTERNSPTLTNIAYHNAFFWDGGNHSLEIQVIGPIENENEMNLSVQVAIERLKQDPEYPELFRKAYQLNEPTIFGLTRAIAAFERTLISGNSNYDKYFYQGQSNSLNANEIAGMNLFFGNNLRCAECHSGFNFTNLNYENNGIYAMYADSGRAAVTLNPNDNGKFKIPTLRNIALTAPYMHDGSFATLENVIDHYAQGGQNHANQNSKISGFSITTQEKSDLIAFLHTLTDYEFINNPNFSVPTP